MNRDRFFAEQANRTATKWDVYFISQRRGTTGVSVRFRDVKADNKERAISKVIDLLSNIEDA